MALRNLGLLALVFATYPTHAQDLKKELRTFKQMGFADLATSACTAYLDCYGGDDRKAVKVHSYADDDDFFDDDLYAAMS